MPLHDMTDPNPSLPPADTALEVLTFGMGGETFALDAVLVREILDMVPRTPVPGADALVGHVINFRGRVIPLADLRPAFGMERQDATPDSRIIVVELTIDDEPTLIGLTTDSVEEVATFDTATCEAPPAIGMRWPREHVRGLFKRDNGIVVLPDLHALFQMLAARAGVSTIH
ncbi:chemotaxis protein CheW [Sphingomonas sp. CFBP 13720]|uniref:chemotaxis protein CheW n=1 Tax=Sphingomonas sp. CFBP 13720 TaxID=2775302 RepID=UPI0031391914